MGSDFQTYTDGELARQCQEGSLIAFEELVYRYEGRIYGFAANAFGNTTDAREVTQDTFVRAYQAIAQFDCRREFGPWLFTIARRKCIDRYRSAPSGLEEPLPELADNDDPAELLAREEERQNLWNMARRRLPRPQFEVLWLKYVEEISVAGIAQVLRKTQTHVKVLLFRARRMLAGELKRGHVPGLPARRGASRIAMEAAANYLPVVEQQRGGQGRSAIELCGAMVSPAQGAARKGPL